MAEMKPITQVRQLRNALGAHPGGFAVDLETHREEIPTRRLVPFTLTRLALEGYRLSARLEESAGDDRDTMLILATQDGVSA